MTFLTTSYGISYDIILLGKILGNLLGVTPRTIRNHIKYLIDNDYIERIGANKNVKWIVKGNKAK